MAVKGIHRYVRLWRHIANPAEYIIHKGARHQRDLLFRTRPVTIQFSVPASLYALFKEIFMEDAYEIDTLVKTLPANPTILDIGANAGFFITQLVSKLGEARIYAYEPMAANIETLQRTIARNPWLASCVQLFPMAVTGTAQDELVLFAETGNQNQVVASAVPGFHENNYGQLTVPCTTLADIIQRNEIQVVDLLKLDCEGSEYDIIYQTDPALFLQIKRMVVEVHDLDNERNNVLAFDLYVQSLGYQTSYTPISANCYVLKANR